MRYIEGFHGIFRDYGPKPSVWQLEQYRKDFYDQNPDVPRMDKNQFFSFGAAFIGVLVFLFGLFIKNDNLPLIGASGAVLYISLKYIIGYSRANYPKSEKSQLILPIVAFGASLIIFVYNVLRIFGIIPVSQLGNDVLLFAFCAWIGGATLLMQFFHAFKMNIKCTDKAEGTLIGYSDYKTTVSSGHNSSHDVTASNYVYRFDVDGEEYTVVEFSKSVNDIFIRSLGSSHVIKYDPKNPEFCMVKHFELKSIIYGLIAGLICGWFAVGSFNTIIKYDLDDPYGENIAQMPSIIVVDENGVAHGIDTYESIQATTTATETSAEPTETPVPTSVPIYSDEWVIENYDTDDFVCYVYPVVAIEGDNAYMGTVPGLYSRLIPVEDFEVGDEILFINFRGSYLYYKLDEGESYTGTHTPENRGWVSEDGRFIFGEDYVDFYYGDGYEVSTYYVQGQDGDDYMIGCDEYYYIFNDTYINDISHWNMELGHVYYGASNDTTVFIVDSDLFVLP